MFNYTCIFYYPCLIIVIQLYERLCAIGLSVSHKTVTSLVEKISHSYDEAVNQWRDNCKVALALALSLDCTLSFKYYTH